MGHDVWRKCGGVVYSNVPLGNSIVKFSTLSRECRFRSLLTYCKQRFFLAAKFGLTQSKGVNSYNQRFICQTVLWFRSIIVIVSVLYLFPRIRDNAGNGRKCVPCKI